MGIFDSLRRKKSPPNSDRKRLEKDVQRLIDESGKRIAAAYAHAEQVIQSQPKLTERDRTLIEAASIGLIPVPAHLAWMLEGYNRTVAETQRLENEIYDEYGIAYDDKSAAYSLLRWSLLPAAQGAKEHLAFQVSDPRRQLPQLGKSTPGRAMEYVPAASGSRIGDSPRASYIEYSIGQAGKRTPSLTF